MKLYHYNLLLGIHAAVFQNFFVENKRANQVLETLLKQNKKWGSKDRAVVSEVFYNIVRWKRRLEFYADQTLTKENIFEIILADLLWEKIDFKDFEEFKTIDKEAIGQRIQVNQFPDFATEQSFPDWLCERLSSELGESFKTELIALNQQALTILRVNTLKTSREKLLKELETSRVVAKALQNYPDAIELEEKKNLIRSEAFQKGWFEIQDASSQLVAAFLNPMPGSVVVDACAGGGGKTLHLAALMQNQGRIVAMDIFENKLKELQKRAARAGVKNIETHLIEESTDLNRFKEIADFLLIDAPCSGLGVLKRNPDAKWKLSEVFLTEIIKTQQQILNDYSQFLKPGGKMVYATCSILPSENRQQIEYFLSTHPGFELLNQRKILPSRGYDGFYMALIQRL